MKIHFWAYVKHKGQINYSETKVTLNESPRYPWNMNETGFMQMFPQMW